MWEDQDEEQDEDEEDGLAGQLLSDILATSKYGERFEERSGGKCLFCACGTGSRAPKRHRRWWAPRFPAATPGDASSPGLCLSLPPVRLCLTEDDYYEDDEEDDPDALKDPLYQIDLQVRLSRGRLASDSVSGPGLRDMGSDPFVAHHAASALSPWLAAWSQARGGRGLSPAFPASAMRAGG